MRSSFKAALPGKASQMSPPGAAVPLVTEWCQRGHRFQAAIGRAGAGKTTTVATCADAWTAAGYRVLGAAVKGEATRTLAAATGIECETVAWHLVHTGPQNLPLGSRTILVVEEASTLSDRDLDTLMGMAAATGASLRLIGDPAQHGAITAGACSGSSASATNATHPS